MPGDHGADLARAIASDWPDPQLGQPVLELGLAECWDSWQSPEPKWTGTGQDLLSSAPPAAVVGLWWD